MKIGIYKDTFANNRGADIAVRNLAAGLAERGHAVALFDKTGFAAKVHGDYDVIISTGTNEILDLANVEGLPPIVQQFHTDPRYPFRHWIRRWRRNRAVKTALRKATAFQVLGEAHVKALQRLLGGVRAEEIAVIGNWSGYESSACPEQGESKIVICPGAINKDKNQILLVDAFAAVAPDFPDWQVHIYGSGKAREVKALERRIAVKGLSGRILVKGFADLSRPYADCAFVAFPSKTEGFGMVVLDAALFGKCAVMISDWIGSAANGGGIVTGTTVGDFADGLRRMMSDSEARKRIGENAWTFCRDSYSRDKILDAWERLLTEVSKRR
jgi:glycosyltransferase involved in cell wall biosynthesis